MIEIDLVYEANKLILKRQIELNGGVVENAKEEKVYVVDLQELDEAMNASFRKRGPTIQEAIHIASTDLAKFNLSSKPSLENFTLREGKLANRIRSLQGDLPHADEVYLYWAMGELDSAFYLNIRKNAHKL